MDISATCDNCGATESVKDLHPDNWKRYLAGEYVQVVWPHLTPAEREVLIGARFGVHTCSACWDVLFGEED